jgi:hypothetical protein
MRYLMTHTQGTHYRIQSSHTNNDDILLPFDIEFSMLDIEFSNSMLRGSENADSHFPIAKIKVFHCVLDA